MNIKEALKDPKTVAKMVHAGDYFLQLESGEFTGTEAEEEACKKGFFEYEGINISQIFMDEQCSGYVDPLEHYGEDNCQRWLDVMTSIKMVS